jgi:hypothetical protein
MTFDSVVYWAMYGVMVYASIEIPAALTRRYTPRFGKIRARMIAGVICLTAIVAFLGGSFAYEYVFHPGFLSGHEHKPDVVFEKPERP